MPVVCPYLVADDGAWRRARPSRDHRCSAVTPPALLALDKQRRLCLVNAHASCATRLAAISEAPYEAAPGASEEGAGPVPAGATRWSLVRTAPLVLDDPSRLSGGRRVPGSPRQWALAVAMAAALGAFVLARLPEPPAAPEASPAVLAATGEPAAAAAADTARPATPSPARASRRTPSPAGVAPASGTPVPPPTLSAAPSAPAIHVVRAGDTLHALARAYGTTVRALQDANGLGSDTVLRIGQELVLP